MQKGKRIQEFEGLGQASGNGFYIGPWDAHGLRSYWDVSDKILGRRKSKNGRVQSTTCVWMGHGVWPMNARLRHKSQCHAVLPSDCWHAAGQKTRVLSPACFPGVRANPSYTQKAVIPVSTHITGQAIHSRPSLHKHPITVFTVKGFNPTWATILNLTQLLQDSWKPFMWGFAHDLFLSPWVIYIF